MNPLLLIFSLTFSLHAQSKAPIAKASPESEIKKLEAAVKKRPDSLEAREKLALAYAQNNQPEKTIELLNPFTDQLSEGAFLTLAASYSATKDHLNEVRVLKTLSDRNEENFQWQMLLGQAYLKLAGETTDPERKAAHLTTGIQALRRTLEISPAYKPAFDLLLATFLQQKDHTEARELLVEGLERFRQRPELQRELCRLDAQDGFIVQALASCKESIKLSPTYPDHYVFLVQALYDQKEEQRAEAQIVSAARRFPGSEFVQWAAGKLFMEKKNYPVAARYYEAATKADPNSSRATFGLAKALFESGREDEALASFVKACKADASTMEAFWAATGRIKQKSGDKNVALGKKYQAAANTCR